MQRQKVYASLHAQNEPAIVDGVKGFWCQADCVFIPASTSSIAIERYRQQIGSASIGISHNRHCDAIRRIVRLEEGGAA